MDTREITQQGSFLEVPPDEGRRTVEEARQAAAQAHAQGLPGSEVARLYSDRIESLLVGELSRALEAHPVPHASLLAMGGFGRRELAPYSDIDLLLVVPADADRRKTAALATALFTPLWDAGLEPGHALRTPEEALAGAADDHTIATALVDARVIGGDSQAGQTLLASFWERMHHERLDAFVQAKCEELQERRKRHLGSIFLLEPNIKNGVGGLRDMACALWVARVRHRLQGLDGVAHFGLLPRRELVQVRAAYERLLRMRCALHLIAGRRDDRLTFSRQEKLAVVLGYQDEADTLAVELLMRDYYLAAQTIEHATDAIIDRCATDRWDRHRAPRPSTPIDASLELFDGHVTFRPGARPAERPALLVDLFASAERHGAPVLPSARDLVAQAAERLKDDLDAWREAVQAFLDYLESPGATGEALSGLYETGVIGVLVPAFARLRARVQHDVYHVYTVDAHTLFAVKKMLRLRAGLMAVDLPDFTRTVQDLPEPLHLLVGLLFHDLGKGLGGDHSTKGEAIVREWGERAGLSPALIEDAAFLVREHLRLPQVAFRRDLSDPALVSGVATLVGSRERLDMLYLLTWADISSVGPETWNAWRAGLLAELYAKVRAQFEEHAAPGPSTRDRPASTQAGAKALRQLVKDGDQLERFIALLPERYLATVSASRARAHYELWSQAGARRLSGHQVPRPDVRGAGEVVVIADDRPGLLAAIAGAFAANGIDILNAEIFSLSDGRALDTFLVREPGNLPPAADRVALALKDLEAILEGRETAPELLARRRGKGSLWAPGPALPTKVRFDLSAARASTVVDVFTRDRVGLLHDIAEAIYSEGASIVLARIATEGNRAADGFYLQDAEGRKITDPARLDAIRRVIERVLEERAREP